MPGGMSVFINKNYEIQDRKRSLSEKYAIFMHNVVYILYMGALHILGCGTHIKLN